MSPVLLLLLQEVKTPDNGKWQPLQDCPNKWVGGGALGMRWVPWLWLGWTGPRSRCWAACPGLLDARLQAFLHLLALAERPSRVYVTYGKPYVVRRTAALLLAAAARSLPYATPAAYGALLAASPHAAQDVPHGPGVLLRFSASAAPSATPLPSHPFRRCNHRGWCQIQGVADYARHEDPNEKWCQVGAFSRTSK